MYRVGWPFWKWAARHVPLLIRLEVEHDREAGVFIVTSNDLDGLVVEIPDTASAADLHREIDDCVSMLMAEALKKAPKSSPVTAWRGDALAA